MIHEAAINNPIHCGSVAETAAGASAHACIWGNVIKMKHMEAKKENRARRSPFPE